jgi:hypothetical protein
MPIPPGMFTPIGLPDKTLAMFNSDLAILRGTASRPPDYSCFGYHEWAILYEPPDSPIAALRHQEKDNPDLRLRVSQEALNKVVESHDLRCTHHDGKEIHTNTYHYHYYSHLFKTVLTQRLALASLVVS